MIRELTYGISEPKEFNLTDDGLILSFSEDRYLSL